MVVACPIKSVRPVERAWPQSTVVCVGSGPSLTRRDVDYCRGRAHVIAIKDAVRYAPWADALYGADERWWEHVGPTVDFDGLKFALISPDAKWVDLLERLYVHRLLIGGETGIDPDPTKLRTGRHSGFSALNLAVHLGASKIVLLGYDMRASAQGHDHFFGAHQYSKKNAPYQYVDTYTTVVKPLAALGIAIVNATRDTALTTFPSVSLAEALTP